MRRRGHIKTKTRESDNTAHCSQERENTILLFTRACDGGGQIKTKTVRQYSALYTRNYDRESYIFKRKSFTRSPVPCATQPPAYEQGRPLPGSGGSPLVTCHSILPAYQPTPSTKGWSAIAASRDTLSIMEVSGGRGRLVARLGLGASLHGLVAPLRGRGVPILGF